MFEITNKTRQRIPRLPFSDIKKAILGSSYDLSLVFIGSAKSRALNKKHRCKDKSANVLSFSLGKKDGEIFIDLSQASIDSTKFGESYTNFIAHLFTHGLFHLKGLEHGSTMENEEKKVLKKYVL